MMRSTQLLSYLVLALAGAFLGAFLPHSWTLFLGHIAASWAGYLALPLAFTAAFSALSRRRQSPGKVILRALLIAFISAVVTTFLGFSFYETLAHSRIEPGIFGSSFSQPSSPLSGLSFFRALFPHSLGPQIVLSAFVLLLLLSFAQRKERSDIFPRLSLHLSDLLLRVNSLLCLLLLPLVIFGESVFVFGTAHGHLLALFHFLIPSFAVCLFILIVYMVAFAVIMRSAVSLRLLRLLLPSLVASLFTQNMLISLSSQFDGLERTGLKKRFFSYGVLFFSQFGRGGTALFSLIGFIEAIRSYSTLPVSFGQLLLFLLFAVVLSFAALPFSNLLAIPAMLAVLTFSLHEPGLPAVTAPLIPFWAMMATLIDSMGSLVMTAIVLRFGTELEQRALYRAIGLQSPLLSGSASLGDREED